MSLRTAEIADAVPSKMLEAMGRGVPVLLAAAGEAARTLEQSGGGLVARPGDEIDLADALVRLAAMGSDARREMGRRGRDSVIAHHRREDAARAFSTVLCDVAAECRVAAGRGKR